MRQHTPTPWTVVTHNGVSLIDGDADRIGVNVEDPANAAFIVRCVNSHDALVAELDAALWALEHPDAQIQRLAAISAVRSALALAKEA